MIRFLLFLLCCGPALALDDFRPLVAEALARGEKKITVPPGTYRLAPTDGKCVWSLQQLHDVEIIADGVTLLATKLTRALAIHACDGLSIRGLVIDYDPLPFTQGTVAAVADDHSWIDINLHHAYPRQAWSRIDVVDPATRYRKKGMPFLWGTKAEMRSDHTVRVTLKEIGRIAPPGTLASLSTGPAPDGIPHALTIEASSRVTLRDLTIHSAPGMGILEADGDGRSRFLDCRVIPGPKPPGATEERLLSTSWDAIQSKTIRHGPHVENCEIRDAGDDSWSIQSSDFLVLKRTARTLIVAARDEFSIGVETGDRLRTIHPDEEAKIVSLRRLSRADASLDQTTIAKLTEAPAWSLWKVSSKCIEVSLDRELPVKAGDSLYSPDRMGNGFVFLRNRIRSAGRVLIKAAGRIEDNLLDTPHGLVVCPEIPGDAATCIDGLVIRGNTIRRAGWFCPAPWSSQAGALSISAAGSPGQLRPPGTFANVLVEHNSFEDCSLPNLVASSVRGLTIRNNRFLRPVQIPPHHTGSSYGIPNHIVLWTARCQETAIHDNPGTEPDPRGNR